MVRDAHDAVAGHPEPAPRMLRQPADAPPPVEHIGASAPVMLFRRVWSDGQIRTKRTLRGWAARITGRSDRRLLLALASATDATAAHCDILVDRITAQEVLTADLAATFGRDITELRAEVAHLRRSLDALRDPGS
jgi:hypothetical protein